MSKKFKSSASSARAASAALGSSSPFGFGSQSSFQTVPSSLSYIAEQPDLSAISNPNIVVALRNLGKKDSTTKAKALEDLQEHIGAASSPEDVESALLEAWVSVYPRTAIDNSRRVRQLAHTLQGLFTTKCGKKIAPQLAKVIGTWLAGAFDTDKIVARAAQDSVAASFPTDQKRAALWKVYKDALAEYAHDALLVQTSQSLSDERTTTPDDAEAKFVRVVGTAMLMLAQVIKVNFVAEPTLQPSRDTGKVRDIVVEKRLWEYASHRDPTLRKGVCSLSIVCAKALPGDLDWSQISSSFIGKALHADQLGSTTQLADALLVLTMVRPEIWTSDYSSKASPTKRLIQFLRNGSQRGSDSFWTTISQLLLKIPVNVISPNGDGGKVPLPDALALIEAIQDGVTNPSEPRQNLEVAWPVYTKTAFWLAGLLNDAQGEITVITDHVLPLADQYLAPTASEVKWVVPNSVGPRLSATILVSVLRKGHIVLFEESWSRYYQSLSDSMKLSLPESSKEFAKSQDAVIAHSQRLFGLENLLLHSDALDQSQLAKAAEVFRSGHQHLVKDAVELLKSRNGKPYGAAGALEKVASQSSVNQDPVLLAFLSSEALDLLDSPSSEYLMSLVLHIKQIMDPFLTRLTQRESQSAHGVSAMSKLLSHILPDDLQRNPGLQDYVLHSVTDEWDQESSRKILKAVLQNINVRDSELHDRCLQALLNHLSSEANSQELQATLKFLDTLASNPATASLLVSDPFGGLLLSSLLILSDASPEVSELANALTTRLKKVRPEKNSAAEHRVSVIAEQLSGTAPFVPIFALIDLAKDVFQSSSDKEKASESLLPNQLQWRTALQPHLGSRRPLSLAISSPLHGAAFLINQESHPSIPLERDADEFALAFRLILYVTRMTSETDIMSYVSEDYKEPLLSWYPIGLQLVNEKLTIESANDIWLDANADVVNEAADVLSQGSSILQGWISDPGRSAALVDLWSTAIFSTLEMSSSSYLAALAFTDILTRHVDEHGPTFVMSKFEPEMRGLHRASNLAFSAGFIAACRAQLLGSQQGRRVLNELIADSTEFKRVTDGLNALKPLVLLDLLLDGSPEPLESIPPQRVVFLMQSLTRALEAAAEDDFATRTEVLRILEPVLIATRDTYGDHWESVLSSLERLWANGNSLQNDLPVFHASLRLYSRLRILTQSDDPNEDLLEAWKTACPSLEQGLLTCLESFRDATDEANQPRRIVTELLRRQLSHINVEHDEKLYDLLSSSDEAVRSAAYDLLHRSIPALQEQRSLDLALEQKVVSLPTEVLAQLSETPDRPTSALQSYLLRWHLIFDHFPRASYKLREIYAAQIKDVKALPSLLEVVCDQAHVTTGRPTDASKFDIQSFELSGSESEGRGVMHLTLHLYYLALLHLPATVRAWFLEQKNHVKTPLETWTTRYFSPTLIAASTSTVVEWASSQSSDSDRALSIKPSLTGAEIQASIEVDPESPPVSLTIALPPSYPLGSPSVIPRTRVGVSERTFTSWTRTISIIILSSGSIIEGLVAFRRNVTGALTGQTECAICYSIIGTEMKVPDKKCGTCKNMFHGGCLFRWFRSSGGSSCPLCRNAFNYA